MGVSNLSNDPLGRKLPSCNDYSSPDEKKKPAASPPPSPPKMNYYYPNYGYPQPCVYPCSPPAAAAKKPEKKAAPAHVCASCSEKSKCKACKKKEDAGKKWVYTPTFWDPRQPPKSIWE